MVKDPRFADHQRSHRAHRPVLQDRERDPRPATQGTVAGLPGESLSPFVRSLKNAGANLWWEIYFSTQLTKRSAAATRPRIQEL